MTDLVQGTSPSQQDESCHTVIVHPHAPQAVWWLIGGSLAVIAACLLLQVGESCAPRAHAQSVGTAGAQGVFAFTGQLSKESYGVFMVDVDAGTVWCYRFDARKNMLNLVAARDWRYDRYLKNFSTEPSAEFIREQVEQERAAALRQASP